MNTTTTKKQLEIAEYARNLYEARKLMGDPISVDESIKIAEQKVIDMYNKVGRGES